MRFYKTQAITLIEFLFVITIIVILSSFAIPAWNRIYKTYRFNDYVFQLENIVKFAKITAMERGINVSVCINNGTTYCIGGDNCALIVYDEGHQRSATCNGTVIKRLPIKESWMEIKKSLTDIIFDPKGFAIFNGNICITDGEKYYKIIISQFGGMRKDSGSGGC